LPIHASFSKPLWDDRNSEFRDDLLGWLKICKRVYFYDYPDNSTYEQVPHPNLRTLADNIKYCVKVGVTGYFGDGTLGHQYTGGMEMAELRAWYIAKLMWDSSLDPVTLIKEFTNGFYGPAGPHIVAYLNVMQDAVDRSGDWLDLSSPADAHFLSIETLTEGWAHLLAGEEAVKNDPALLGRVKNAELPTMFVILVRWDELKDAASCRGIDWPFSDSRAEEYKEFMDIVNSRHITLSTATLEELAKSGKTAALQEGRFQ
jgi:hypothetical protein